MQQLVSDDLWKHIAKLARSGRPLAAAVAYVSTDKLIKFGRGDILVVDASDMAIKNGLTSARVLQAAYNRKAKIFNLPGLHAKLVVGDGFTSIGSANISQASANSLIEAAVITDDDMIAAMAKTVIDQLTAEAQQIDGTFLKRIGEIQVVRRGWPTGKRITKRIGKPFANRMWVANVHELKDSAFPEETEEAEAGMKVAESRLATRRSDVTWIRWTGSGNFSEKASEGDSVIQLWNPRNSSRVYAYRPCPILYRQEEQHRVRFYIEESPKSLRTRKTMKAFVKLAQRAGVPGRIGPNSCRILPDDCAKAIAAMWDQLI